jgi:hypothetical protein
MGYRVVFMFADCPLTAQFNVWLKQNAAAVGLNAPLV